MAKRCEVFTWSALATDRPVPLIERQRVVGEQMMISRVRLMKGFRLASHHHANEQYGVVLSGCVKFGLGPEGTPEHRVEKLGPGQVVWMPADVPHSAEALEESVILDVFAPPSEKTGVDQVRT